MAPSGEQLVGSHPVADRFEDCAVGESVSRLRFVFRLLLHVLSVSDFVTYGTSIFTSRVFEIIPPAYHYTAI